VIIDENLYDSLGGVQSMLGDYLDQVIREDSSRTEAVHAVPQGMEARD
jgi:hypothetical protein